MISSSEQAKYYPLYLVAFVHNVGLIAITTLLPTYIDLLRPSGLAIGLFISAFTFSQTIAVVPLGWAGDRFDKRGILLATLGTCALAYALFPFVETTAGFIAVRTIQGLSVVGVGLLGVALIGELAGPNERATLLGNYNAWKLGGAVVGTLSVGLLYDQFGFSVIFGGIVALFLVGLVSLWWFTEPDKSSVEFAYRALSLNRRILTMSSFRVQYAFCMTIMRNWIPIFVGVSAAQGGLGFAAFFVGVVIAVGKFTNMIAQPFTGRLADAYGRERFVVIGGMGTGLIAFVFPFSPAISSSLGLPEAFPTLGPVSGVLIVVIVLHGIFGFADSFREPASMAIYADEGSEQGGVASSFGIRILVWRPGEVIGPLIAGVVMTQVGMEWVFYIAGAFAITGVVTFVGILKYPRWKQVVGR